MWFGVILVWFEESFKIALSVYCLNTLCPSSLPSWDAWSWLQCRTVFGKIDFSLKKIFFICFYFFLESGEGREKERKRNINVKEKHLWPLIHAPTRDWTYNPGMCPDWESDCWLFALWDNTQPTMPHWSGQSRLFLREIWSVVGKGALNARQPLACIDRYLLAHCINQWFIFVSTWCTCSGGQRSEECKTDRWCESLWGRIKQVNFWHSSDITVMK